MMTGPDRDTSASLEQPSDPQNPPRPTPGRETSPTSSAPLPKPTTLDGRPPLPTPRDAAQTAEPRSLNTDAPPTRSRLADPQPSPRSSTPPSRNHAAPSPHPFLEHLIPTRPFCIIDAYVAERQRFNLLFLPGQEEPLKFRLLDDLLNTVSAANHRELFVHTYSFVAKLSILQLRAPGDPRPWYDYPVKENN